MARSSCTSGALTPRLALPPSTIRYRTASAGPTGWQRGLLRNHPEDEANSRGSQLSLAPLIVS